MPRIKDLSDQWPFKLDRNQLYGELDCRFDATVSQDLIAEQWDQMACLTVSVKNRLAPPKLVVERLAGTVPADRLAKALTAYWANRQKPSISRAISTTKSCGGQFKCNSIAARRGTLPNGIYDSRGVDGLRTRESTLRLIG
jgi:Tn3 transposase DDE domain